MNVNHNYFVLQAEQFVYKERFKGELTAEQLHFRHPNGPFGMNSLVWWELGIHEAKF